MLSRPGLALAGSLSEAETDAREAVRAIAAARIEIARPLAAAFLADILIEQGRLEEAAETLEWASMPARLEHAKALVELGVLLRRSGQRTEARHHFHQSVELAELCGATPLVERGQAELRATGGHPTRTALSGAAALTPSERRVAEMAAAGRSNHEIAQALFTTTKTVEAHLTRAYRKLGIAGRAGLANVFPGPAGL